nr:extracellular solute-binding protein [Mobiluncus mulieris]
MPPNNPRKGWAGTTAKPGAENPQPKGTLVKRITTIGAFAAIVALALSGCGGGASDKAASDNPASLETTIKILASSYADETKTDWENIIKECNKTYPKVKVELQIEGWDDFTSKVQARIQAKDYPDILNDNNYASAADGGLRYPIDEVLSPDVIKTIEPALLKNGVGVDRVGGGLVPGVFRVERIPGVGGLDFDKRRL